MFSSFRGSKIRDSLAPDVSGLDCSCRFRRFLSWKPFALGWQHANGANSKLMSALETHLCTPIHCVIQIHKLAV